MERCTCDEAPDLENREAWQWGGCGDNLKYSSKFVKEFLGRRSSKDLRARVDFHNNLVGVKASGEGARHQVGEGCRGDGGDGQARLREGWGAGRRWGLLSLCFCSSPVVPARVLQSQLI